MDPIVQNASNVYISERMEVTQGGRTHTGFVSFIDPKQELAITLLDHEAPGGTRSVEHVQFDPKASNLSAADLAAGKGTENTWHRRAYGTEQEHARSAGAGH